MRSNSRFSITSFKFEADEHTERKMDDAAKEELISFMKETMMEMQQPLLQAAAENTQRIVDVSIKKGKSELKEEMDGEIAECSKHEKLKNNINESNIDFCRQIKDIWKKAERAVEDKQMEKSKQFFEKGKKIIKNRIQALRIADKEGWDVALAFLDDPLVDGPDEEKRLKKARRTVQTNKSLTNSKKRENNTVSEYERRSKLRNYGASDGRQGTSNYQTTTNSRKSWGQDSKCWSCNRLGHFSSSCPYTRDYRSHRY